MEGISEHGMNGMVGFFFDNIFVDGCISHKSASNLMMGVGVCIGATMQNEKGVEGCR